MTSSITQLVFETHALSEDNEAGRSTGWHPGRLSAHGRALARELGARRRDDRIAAVFVSDLRRATQTAEIAFDGCDLPILPLKAVGRAFEWQEGWEYELTDATFA